MTRKTPPNAQKGTKVSSKPQKQDLGCAWAVIAKSGLIEVSADKSNLPQPGRGEKLVRVKVSV